MVLLLSFVRGFSLLSRPPSVLRNYSQQSDIHRPLPTNPCSPRDCWHSLAACRIGLGRHDDSGIKYEYGRHGMMRYKDGNHVDDNSELDPVLKQNLRGDLRK